MKAKILILSLFASFLIFSCSSDDNGGGNAAMVGIWLKENQEKRTPSTEWAVDTRSCWSDDFEDFESNGDWTFYDGQNLCGPGSGLITGTWALNGNTITFKYDGVPGEYESTLVNVSENRLVVTYFSGDIHNTEFRVTYTR